MAWPVYCRQVVAASIIYFHLFLRAQLDIVRGEFSGGEQIGNDAGGYYFTLEEGDLGPVQYLCT
jgi:hypothetical protein